MFVEKGQVRMPFSVDSLDGSRIVRASISNLFSLDDAAGLQQAYAGLLIRLRYGPGAFDLLVDLRGSPIQPADVVRSLSDFVGRGVYKPARMAFIHGEAAVKMQARRVSTDLGARHYGTEAEAMAWLREPR